MSISKEVIDILIFLIPGICIQILIENFTEKKSKNEFYFVIFALIYTILIQFLVLIIRKLLFVLGEYWFSLGCWDKSTNNIWLFITTIIFGIFIVAFINNNDSVSNKLIKWHWTTKTISNSVWLEKLKEYKDNYIEIELRDGRVLMGYPKCWPEDEKNGCFALTEPVWVDEAEDVYVGEKIECIVIRVDDILSYSIYKNEEEQSNDA